MIFSTATEGGLKQFQAWKALSEHEKDRFAAFRRSCFKRDVISKLVAHQLAAAEERLLASRESAAAMMGASSAQVLGLLRPRQTQSPYIKGECTPLRLDNLVAPGAAPEITAIVSTLAKSYAQRLVAAARNVATAHGYPSSDPLLPHHLRTAFEHRQAAGLDPGFFLHRQTTKATTSMATIYEHSRDACAAVLGDGVMDRYQLKVLAALEAQRQVDGVSESEGGDDDISVDERDIFAVLAREDKQKKQQKMAEKIQRHEQYRKALEEQNRKKLEDKQPNLEQSERISTQKIETEQQIEAEQSKSQEINESVFKETESIVDTSQIEDPLSTTEDMQVEDIENISKSDSIDAELLENDPAILEMEVEEIPSNLSEVDGDKILEKAADATKQTNHINKPNESDEGDQDSFSKAESLMKEKPDIEPDYVQVENAIENHNEVITEDAEETTNTPEQRQQLADMSVQKDEEQGQQNVNSNNPEAIQDHGEDDIPKTIHKNVEILSTSCDPVDAIDIKLEDHTYSPKSSELVIETNTDSNINIEEKDDDCFVTKNVNQDSDQAQTDKEPKIQAYTESTLDESTMNQSYTIELNDDGFKTAADSVQVESSPPEEDAQDLRVSSAQDSSLEGDLIMLTVEQASVQDDTQNEDVKLSSSIQQEDNIEELAQPKVLNKFER